MSQNTKKKAAPVDAVQMASAEIGHIPPQAPEVEEAVIGSMMLDKDSVYLAMESLKEKSFYDSKMRLIFSAMSKLFKERSAIDMMTVSEQLRTDGTLKEIGGPGQLASLTSKVGSGANIEYYVKILQQKTIQRDLIEVGYGILRKAFDETYEVDRLIEESQSEVYNAVQGNMRSGYVDLGEAINMAMERLEWVQKTDGLTGIPSGFPTLDAITRGWQNGNLIVIGARPGHGKSAIALNMAVAAAVDNNIPTAFFTLEMANIELADRIIGSEAGLVSGKRKGKDKMEDYEWKQLESALVKVVKAPLYIDETPGLTIAEFTSKIKRMVQEKGVKIAFADYLQLMHATGNYGTNRALEIGDISRQLKETAKELRIPIIALAQLNRNVTQRLANSMGRPMLSDLKDSGSIEQDADMVLFINRPAKLGLSEMDESYAELIIEKNRAGEAAVIQLNFNGSLTKFTEESQSLTAYAAQPIPSAANGPSPVDISPTPGYAPYDFDRSFEM